MIDSSKGLPYRHLARLQSEFHLECLAALLRVGPNRFVRAVVLQAIARTCVGDWVAPAGFAPPDEASAATTALALAGSLHRPFETVRRHVDGLIDDGLCVRRGHRVFLNPNAGMLRRYYEEMHDAFLRLVGRVAAFGVSMPIPPAGRPHPTATVTRLALDLSLEPLDTFRASDWDWNSMLLWMAVSAMEVQHVTYDETLSRLYAVAYTPDHLRRPVNLHSVAARLSMPYASAWRRARLLEAAGLMSRRPDGWLIAGSHLRDARIEGTLVVHSHRLLSRIRSVVLDGLDPATVSAGMIARRF